MVTEKNRQNNDNVQRMPAEEMYQREIDALIASEKDPVPSGWRMSPRSVLTYITGGRAGGVEITPTYIGRHTRHRPRPAFNRRTGNGQIMAVGTFNGRH